MSYQKIIAMGNIGKLEVKNGVVKLSVAVNDRYKKKDGTVVDETEWFNCVSFGKQSEIISQYFQVGSKILIEARKKTNKWQDENGNNRYTEEFIVKEFSFVDKKNDNQPQNNVQNTPQAQQSQQTQHQQQPRQNNAPQGQQLHQNQQQNYQQGQQQNPVDQDLNDSIPF